jgi:hypothetical protein
MVLEQFFLLLESEARLDPSRPHQLSCKYGEKKPNPPTLEIRQGIGHPGIQKPLKGWATHRSNPHGRCLMGKPTRPHHLKYCDAFLLRISLPRADLVFAE